MSAPLVVACVEGLANRLRVLLSGMALAERTGREFTMLWPRTAACGAAFHELFDNRWNVEECPADDALALPRYGGYLGDRLPDLIHGDPRLSWFRAADWLVTRDAGWRSRLTQSGRFRAPPEEHRDVMTRAVELLTELAPVAEIADEVHRFGAARFAPETIGVHLRRGDLLRARPDVAHNTRAAQALVDVWLAELPGAAIFLCTDDGARDVYRDAAVRPEGVRRAFSDRHGDRVLVREPSSLDRRDPAAIADALVELLLLRRCAPFVGTRGSSFSELAVAGRDVPHALLAGGRGRDRVLRYTGVEAALVATGWLAYGRPLPAPAVLRRARIRVRRGRAGP